jgi:hypothetical protein
MVGAPLGVEAADRAIYRAIRDDDGILISDSGSAANNRHPGFLQVAIIRVLQAIGSMPAKGFAKAAADCLAAFEMWSRQSRSSRTIDDYRQKFENHLAQWRESPPQRRVADASVRHDAELLATERIF